MSKSAPPLQLLPPPVAQLIEVFEQHADVLSFPNSSAKTLKAAVAEMEREQAGVDAAAAELEGARERLKEAQQRLLDQAQKAHAYASVYALDDEAMQDRLAQIKMGAVPRTARKRKPKPNSADGSPSQETVNDKIPEQASAAETSVTDTPVTDTPVTDTPVTDTPVTDTSVTEPSVAKQTPRSKRARVAAAAG
jgi:ribonuclease E